MIKKEKILICSFEYYPKGKGIANLVYHTRNEFEKLGHKVDVCSTIGPEIQRGSLKLVEKLGGLGIVYYWMSTSYFLFKNHRNYDRIILHNPMLYLPIQSNKVYGAVHTLYLHMFLDYAKKKPMNWLYYPVMIFFEALSYFLFQRDLKYIVTSPKTISELDSYMIKKDMTILFNGITKSKIEKSKIRLKQNKNDIAFMNVCRLDSQKNLFKLLDLFKVAEKENWKLYIAGDGELRNQLEQHIKENKIKNVKLLGLVPHEQILDLFRQSDFFISSSLYEGYPLVLSEALGMGAIPILSEIEIYKYMTNKLKVGTNLDFEDSQKCYKKLKQFIEKTSINKQSASAKNYADKNLTWKKIAQDYLNAK